MSPAREPKGKSHSRGNLPERRGALGEDLIPTPDKRSGRPDPVPNRRRRKRITPKQIDRVEKMREALRLRVGGATTEQIAQELGYADRSGASKLIKEALRARLSESVDELRELENERLDMLMRQAVPKAVKDGPSQWRYIEMILRISEARRALNGLDAPTRVTIDGETRNMVLTIDATNTEVMDNLHDLLRQRPAQRPAAELGPATGEPPGLPDIVLEADDGG